jgi:tricorn protease-like protein
MKLLNTAKGKQIRIAVAIQKDGKKSASKTFHIHVAEDPVDSHIAYRLIEPGYALWNRMGIYLRELETYKETAVYENKMSGYNCVNCHSFCNRNPDKMLFHIRSGHAGTVLIDGDEIEILQTKTDRTISPLVYPAWHPSGQFIAFSVNKTTQELHPAQRVEVFDKASDVVVYDIEEQTLLVAPPIFSKGDFETFPAFSADGKTLYFCSGTACAVPDSIRQLRYSLCSIAFDPVSKSFGSTVDTLYNAATTGQSVSFPRISPDGNYLLCTLSSYGTFPIWHRDADLYIIDLKKREGKPLDAANSEYADSYHSWSSNSRWIVFSSRRMDGLYTRPFLAYINETGDATKPFLLPQKNAEAYYAELMKSYNIPEFVSGEIKNRSYAISRKAKDKNSIHPVKFKRMSSR